MYSVEHFLGDFMQLFDSLEFQLVTWNVKIVDRWPPDFQSNFQVYVAVQHFPYFYIFPVNEIFPLIQKVEGIC